MSTPLPDASRSEPPPFGGRGGPCRVAVGLSGGVDSIMAAWLLRERGHEVIGLTMQLWNPERKGVASGRGGCFGPGEIEDIARAARLAARLGIPHHVIPLYGEYEERVLAYFRRTYRAGRTPNPCAVCNPVMKFGLLPEAARASGLAFEFLATGHYARRLRDPESGLFRLCRGADRNKDQSYFLARLTQDQLARALFPLGDRTKEEVRALARQQGFEEAADQAESQDFFDGEDRGPLFGEDPVLPGDIVDREGHVLGRHRGIVHYTVGQREGLGIAARRRLYVLALDAESNRVVVGERDEALREECLVTDPHWISGSPPVIDRPCTVCLRYRHPGTSARLEPAGEGRLRLRFHEPQFAVTPGQLAACYDGDELLGGGWIDSERRADQ